MQASKSVLKRYSIAILEITDIIRKLENVYFSDKCTLNREQKMQ